MRIAEISPATLRPVDDEELLALNQRCHQLWGAHFDGTAPRGGGGAGLSREDLVNAAAFVWAEMRRRGFDVSTDTPLWRAVRDALNKAQCAPVLCIYHRDLDGITAAAIVYQATGRACDLIDVNYGEPFDFELVKGREAIYVVDFSFQPFSDMVKLQNLCQENDAELIWIEHHKEAIKSANDAGFSCAGIQQTGDEGYEKDPSKLTAGCDLTWRFFYEKEPEPLIIWFAGRWDVWDHSDDMTPPMHYAMEAMELTPDSPAWVDLIAKKKREDFNAEVELGKKISAYLKAQNKLAMEGLAYPVRFEGLRCIAANVNAPGSVQFESVADGYDAMIRFSWHASGMWKVGMYAVKPGVDVGAVCKKHGGGGHKGAGGFECSELPFELGKAEKDKTEKSASPRATAPTLPGSVGELEPIELAEVMVPGGEPLRPIFLRRPAVTLVGSVCTQGKTRADVDMLLHGPLDQATRHVIKFRLGRMFDERISARLSWHDAAEYGGPFTDHVPIYDLALMPRGGRGVRDVVRMAAEELLDDLDDLGDPDDADALGGVVIAKQESTEALMMWPPPTRRERPAVIQIHAIGRGAHLDFRALVNAYAVGWTLFAGRAGAVPDINTVPAARRLYAGWTAADGNEYLKPIASPRRQGATPKLVQPRAWLDLEGRVFEPGEVAAGSEEQGVIVAVARPRVAWGLQLSHFHEYHLSGDKQWCGPLYFRLLAEADGKPFWTAMLSSDPFPSVLRKRSVDAGHMPPLGHSALPRTLEDVTPEGLRYWQADTDAEAKRLRDALVAERFFTPDTVKIVDSEYRRIVRKAFVDLGDVGKVERRARFALSWLFARGPDQTRSGPTRQSWLFILENPGGDGVRLWALQSNPIGATGPIAAIEHAAHIAGRRALELLEADRELAPGEEIGGAILNDTAATPMWIRQQIQDTLDVVAESDDELVVEIGSHGVEGRWRLRREAPGMPVWIWERVAT